MAPSAEPIRQQILDSAFNALDAIRTDTAGTYWTGNPLVFPKHVEQDKVKRYPAIFVTDGPQDFEGLPGGDHDTEIQFMVGAYLKDSNDLAKARARLARDIIVALQVDRSRGSLGHDTIPITLIHSGHEFDPFCSMLMSFRVRYRMQGSEL